MSKGIKMTFCRIIESGKSIHVNKVLDSQKDILECDRCEAKVVKVDSYLRQSSHTWVPAYLRLAPKETHKEGCLYITENAVNYLVKNSKEIGESDLLAYNSDGVCEFRLHIITEKLEKIDISQDSTHNSLEASSTRNTPVTSNNSLNDYIKNAVAVARLYNATFDKKEIRGCIIIQFKTQKVPWSNFFYSQDNYADLIKNKLGNKLSLFSGGTRYSIPVAIIIVPKLSKEIVEKEGVYTLQCFADRNTKAKEEKRYIPRLRTNNPALIQNLKETQYIFCGDFFFNSNDNFVNIFLKLNHRAQICQL